jgi:protein SFI1
MSKFRPTRTSPPSKPQNIQDSLVLSTLSDISRSSAGPVPELTGLTPTDVDILDSVIQRAAQTTTFLSVFKAYNDVLLERGLDPHEVVYYGKLLKLGTLKGKNWGDKWNMVKLQHRYEGNFAPTLPVKRVSSSASPQTISTFLHTRPTTTRRDNSFTLHSSQDDTEISSSGAEDSAPQYHMTQRTILNGSQSPPESTALQKSRGHDVGTRSNLPPLSPAPQLHFVPPLGMRNIGLYSDASDVTEVTAESLSNTPPSYRAAVHDPILHRPFAARSISRDRPLRPPSTPTIIQVKEHRGGVINEHEAWDKIKTFQDEKEADRFREDNLVERCWDVWKKGFEWIHVRTFAIFTFAKFPMFPKDDSSSNRPSSQYSSDSYTSTTLADPCCRT